MRKLICLILVLALFPVLPALAESAGEAAVRIADYMITKRRALCPDEAPAEKETALES